jgi:NADH-quinone oxidoreductase subunit L
MSIHGFLTLPFWLMVAGFFTAYFIFYKKYIRLTAPKFINTIINARYGFDTLNEKVLAPLVLFFGNILWKFFDIKIIDNILVNGTARLINIFSQTTKKIQTGYVSQYAFFMVLGLLGFASFFIIGWIK